MSVSEKDARGWTPGKMEVERFVLPRRNEKEGSVFIRSRERHWALGEVFAMTGCTNPSLDISLEEMKANATLWASAPEMYEALKAIDLARHTDAPADWEKATRLSDAALRRAEGRED